MWSGVLLGPLEHPSVNCLPRCEKALVTRNVGDRVAHLHPIHRWGYNSREGGLPLPHPGGRTNTKVLQGPLGVSPAALGQSSPLLPPLSLPTGARPPPGPVKPRLPAVTASYIPGHL